MESITNGRQGGRLSLRQIDAEEQHGGRSAVDCRRKGEFQRLRGITTIHICRRKVGDHTADISCRAKSTVARCYLSQFVRLYSFVRWNAGTWKFSMSETESSIAVAPFFNPLDSHEIATQSILNLEVYLHSYCPGLSDSHFELDGIGTQADARTTSRHWFVSNEHSL
jgi:hypothetical protein